MTLKPHARLMIILGFSAMGAYIFIWKDATLGEIKFVEIWGFVVGVLMLAMVYITTLGKYKNCIFELTSLGCKHV